MATLRRDETLTFREVCPPTASRLVVQASDRASVTVTTYKHGGQGRVTGEAPLSAVLQASGEMVAAGTMVTLVLKNTDASGRDVTVTAAFR